MQNLRLPKILLYPVLCGYSQVISDVYEMRLENSFDTTTAEALCYCTSERQNNTKFTPLSGVSAEMKEYFTKDIKSNFFFFLLCNRNTDADIGYAMYHTTPRDNMLAVNICARNFALS